MQKPLSAKTIVDFLRATGDDLTPVYIQTPDGDILELTRMALLNFEDEDTVAPVFTTQYTDIAIAEMGTTIGEPYSYLPPS